MSENQGPTDKAIDKATEKVCIERWQWTLAKIIAVTSIISAIAHIGEAAKEIVQILP